MIAKKLTIMDSDCWASIAVFKPVLLESIPQSPQGRTALESKNNHTGVDLEGWDHLIGHNAD